MKKLTQLTNTFVLTMQRYAQSPVPANLFSEPRHSFSEKGPHTTQPSHVTFIGSK